MQHTHWQMSDIFVGVAVDIIAAVKAVANEAAERVRASRNLGGLSGVLCSAASRCNP